MFHLVDVNLKPATDEMGLHSLRMAYGDYSTDRPLVGHLTLRFHRNYEITLRSTAEGVEMVFGVGSNQACLSWEELRQLMNQSASQSESRRAAG